MHWKPLYCRIYCLKIMYVLHLCILFCNAKDIIDMIYQHEKPEEGRLFLLLFRVDQNEQVLYGYGCSCSWLFIFSMSS